MYLKKRFRKRSQNDIFNGQFMKRKIKDRKQQMAKTKTNNKHKRRDKKTHTRTNIKSIQTMHKKESERNKIKTFENQARYL